MSKQNAPQIVVVAALGLCAGLGPASLTLIMPSLPAIEAGLDVPNAFISAAQSVFLIGLAIPQLLFGAFSDRFGHRPSLLTGLLLFILGSAMCMFSGGFAWLLIGRLLQAIGASSGMVTSRALIREIYPIDKAAAMMGYLTIGMMVVPMLAPIAGGLIENQFGWRANFAVLGGISMLLIVVVGTTIPHIMIKEPPTARSPFQIYGDLLGSGRFRAYAAQIMLPSLVTQIFFASAPFVFERDYAIPAPVYGAMFALPAIGFMAGNLISGRLLQRFGIDRMIRAGVSLMLAGAIMPGLLFLFVRPDAMHLFYLVAFLSFAQGLVVPGALGGATSALGASFGSAAGMAGFLQWTAPAIGVFALFPLVSSSPQMLVLNYVAFSSLAFVLFVIAMPPSRSKRGSTDI